MNCRCSVHTTGGFSSRIIIMRNVVTARMPHIPKHQNVWLGRHITVKLQVCWYHFTRNCKSAYTTLLETACLLSDKHSTRKYKCANWCPCTRNCMSSNWVYSTKTAYLVTVIILLGIACLLTDTTLLGTASFLSDNTPLQNAHMLTDNCTINGISVNWYHCIRNCKSVNWYHSTRNCISADTAVVETVILLIPLLETAYLLIPLYYKVQVSWCTII
jgi:hypothetical protein